ncbi:MAG: hypothetical protein DMG26_13990 [Acidobacteria bacterium]|nr:MAG: hypothetical protein DMG26_13990 [Acidobacteriota bacterium]
MFRVLAVAGWAGATLLSFLAALLMARLLLGAFFWALGGHRAAFEGPREEATPAGLSQEQATGAGQVASPGPFTLSATEYEASLTSDTQSR